LTPAKASQHDRDSLGATTATAQRRAMSQTF
jgi:hypothetical protein